VTDGPSIQLLHKLGEARIQQLVGMRAHVIAIEEERFTLHYRLASRVGAQHVERIPH